jgi:lipopolysaccharide export system protein LptA
MPTIRPPSTISERRSLVRGVRSAIVVGCALGASLLLVRPSLGQTSPPPSGSASAPLSAGSPLAGPGLPPAIPGNLEMSAELLEVDTKSQTAVLSGKVILARGELSLHCPRIEAKFDGAGARVTWARGSGGVVAEVKGVHAEATEFDLDLDKQHLSLRGGVRLFRSGGWLSADGAEFDLAAGKVTMTSVKASVPVGSALKK